MKDNKKITENNENRELLPEPSSGEMLSALLSVLDSLSGWIYVIDSRTYRMCYVNRQAREIAPGAEPGAYCFKSFMDLDGLCENCPACAAAREKRRVTREFYNGHLKLWAKVSAVPVKWQNTDAVLLQLQDITSYKEEAAADRVNHDERGESVGWDALTNLLTAGGFSRQAERYLESCPREDNWAMMILDMDDFQSINRQRGEIFGNVVLINVASCLRRVCTEDDLIGRFGGDEFLVLLKHADRERAERIAASIKEEIGSILTDVESGENRVSCSIGIYMTGKGETRFPDIITKAALAMREVKEKGKNGICFYDAISPVPEEYKDYSYLWQANEEKRKGQSDLYGKSTTAVALEVFEKTGAFEEAVHILMGFMGNRFRLNRIGLYLNGQEGVTKQAVYQWVDESTAILIDPSDYFRKEEFYICYRLYDEDNIAILERSRYDTYTRGVKQVLDRAGASSILFAGVFIEGRYSGMLALVNTEQERRWTKAECAAVSEVARIIASGASTSQRLKEAKKEMEYYKNRDSLTGLLRYDKFKEECQKILDYRKEEYVLIASDIKGFKYINEAIGYTQGDNILRMFSDMLVQNGVDSNLYTRVSADQFLSFGIYRHGRRELVDAVRELNDEFCRIQNEIYPKIKMMIRSGIYFIERGCREIETAVDRATIARKSVDYIIKSAAVVFNDGPFDGKYRENEIINQMDYALKRGEFKVYFQPKFSLGTHKLVGAEALVRWLKEDKSLIQPADFIPLFEKNGFISQVDSYVLEQVCIKLKEWKEEGGVQIPVSVNLSSVDIQSQQLVSNVLECTRLYGIDHRYLEFELTETAFLKETEHTCEVMKTLQEQGFSISIDDFGSGYSIMNMMAEIPADVIKLDCAFVQSCANSDRGREFLGQLIQMTNKMGFISLCEGIETEEQLDMLTKMGCELGQGYYFSKPVPMDEFFEKFCVKSH